MFKTHEEETSSYNKHSLSDVNEIILMNWKIRFICTIIVITNRMLNKRQFVDSNNINKVGNTKCQILFWNRNLHIIHLYNKLNINYYVMEITND